MSLFLLIPKDAVPPFHWNDPKADGSASGFVPAALTDIPSKPHFHFQEAAAHRTAPPLSDFPFFPALHAVDVNRGPLERAREHIAQYQMGDYIETRLSDGLHELKAGEGDSLLIAGMGGGLTVRILSEGELLLSGFRELILEPQSDIDRVRVWLVEHGFFLAQENFVEEDGIYHYCIQHGLI